MSAPSPDAPLPRPVGATRTASALSERTGWPVRPQHVEVLVEQGHLAVVGHYEGHVLYDQALAAAVPDPAALRPHPAGAHRAIAAARRALDQRTLLRFLRTVARDASLRDRTICHLAYYAGLRVAEIVALDVADLRLSARKGSVRVRGKGRTGGKDRTVPLHAQARTTLEALLDELGRPAAGPLIRNRDGADLSTRAANTVVTNLGAAAGIGPADDGEPFGPHVLRHAFGTDLVRGRGEVATAPVDVVLVAELMGHADLNTTRRYTLPSEADKTRALEALTTDR